MRETQDWGKIIIEGGGTKHTVANINTRRARGVTLFLKPMYVKRSTLEMTPQNPTRTKAQQTAQGVARTRERAKPNSPHIYIHTHIRGPMSEENP